MKNICLLFVLSIFILPANAQQKNTSDSSGVEALKTSPIPFIVIKGDKLKDIPTNNLWEALCGLIPGVDPYFQSPDEYLFYIDDIINSNFNSISINEIEEVQFYRGGLNGINGVLSTEGGTFYIKTKKGEYNDPLTASFRASAGSINQTNFFREEGNSISQNYRIGVNAGYNKIKFNAGLEWLKNFNSNGLDKDNQHKANLNVDIKPLKWLDAGIHANFSPTSVEASSNYDVIDDFNTHVESQQAVSGKIFNIDGYLTINPVKGLSNTFRLSRIKEDLDLVRSTYIIHQNLSNGSYYEDYNQTFYNYSTYLDNKLTYRINTFSPKIHIAASLRYNRIKWDAKTTYLKLINNDYPSQSGGYTKINNDFESWTPDLTFNAWHAVTLQAGLRFDNPLKNGSLSSKSPYVSFDLNFKNLLLKKAKGISALSFNVSYSEYNQGENNPINNNPTGFFWSINRYGVKDIPESGNSFSVGGNIGLWGDRVQLNADWYSTTANELFTINMPYGSGFSTIQTLRPVINKGWRVWAGAKVINAINFAWSTGLNINQNDSKNDFPNVNYIAANENFDNYDRSKNFFTGVNYESLVQLNQIKPQRIEMNKYQGVVTGGFTNTLNYHNFSLTVNTAFTTNRKLFAYPNSELYWRKDDLSGFPEDVGRFIYLNSISISNASFGYTVSKLKFINSLGVFLVARNLFTYENYEVYSQNPSFLGAMVKVSL